jgi:hypothetical protein
MKSPLQVGYVVAAVSDAALARLTIDSILQQERPPELIVVAASESCARALKPTAGESGRIEFVPMPPVTGLGAARGAFYQRALRTAAPRVEVIVFCSEGALFRGDHSEAVARRFCDHEDLVGAIDIFGKTCTFNPALNSVSVKDFCGFLPDGYAKNGVSRPWWHARILTQCALAARAASLRGLSFATLADKFDWTEFSDLLEGLRPRGRVTIAPTIQAVAVRNRPERRSGLDQGYAVYWAMRRAGDDRPQGGLDTSLETLKLALEPLLRAAVSQADRHWCLSFLRGMWIASREARSIRKALARDIRDLA